MARIALSCLPSCCLLLTLLLILALSPRSVTAAAGVVTALPAGTAVTVSGFTRPRATLAVASEVAGRCLSVAAEVGQAVPEDGIFCRLDSTFTDLQLAANDTARQQVSRQLRHDEAEMRRHERLATAQAASQTQSEQAALQRDLTHLKIRQLETEARTLGETRTRHQVPAPAGWLVLERMLEPGAWVSPGQMLARVGDFSGLMVPLALAEAELAALRDLASVKLHLPEAALEGEGRLQRIAPDFDPASRKTRVEVHLTPATMAALPHRRGGLRVQLHLLLPDAGGAVLLPAAAVQERYEEHWLTRDSAERSQVRVILLGQAPPPGDKSGDWVRVVAPDIRAGERFLTGATQTVLPASSR